METVWIVEDSEGHRVFALDCVYSSEAKAMQAMQDQCKKEGNIFLRYVTEYEVK